MHTCHGLAGGESISPALNVRNNPAIRKVIGLRIDVEGLALQPLIIGPLA